MLWTGLHYSHSGCIPENRSACLRSKKVDWSLNRLAKKMVSTEAWRGTSNALIALWRTTQSAVYHHRLPGELNARSLFSVWVNWIMMAMPTTQSNIHTEVLTRPPALGRWLRCGCIDPLNMVTNCSWDGHGSTGKQVKREEGGKCHSVFCKRRLRHTGRNCGCQLMSSVLMTCFSLNVLLFSNDCKHPFLTRGLFPQKYSSNRASSQKTWSDSATCLVPLPSL